MYISLDLMRIVTPVQYDVRVTRAFVDYSIRRHLCKTLNHAKNYYLLRMLKWTFIFWTFFNH